MSLSRRKRHSLLTVLPGPHFLSWNRNLDSKAGFGGFLRHIIQTDDRVVGVLSELASGWVEIVPAEEGDLEFVRAWVVHALGVMFGLFRIGM